MVVMSVVLGVAVVRVLSWYGRGYGHLHFAVLTCVLFLCSFFGILFLKHFVVPSDGFLVRAGGEGFFGDFTWEWLIIFGVDKREDPGGFLQIGNMFFWVQQ